jgi:lysyl-tRNA synthetase class 2
MSVHSLHHRSALLRNIRHFFDQRDFCEVQTPVLSADTIVDRYIEPIIVADDSLPKNYHGSRTYYLQTSQEFAMKRLLAAGMKAIYQISPVFRKGDRGTFHNIEFTMLEWYQTGDDYHAGMKLLADLILEITGITVKFKTFWDVFETNTGLNPHQATAQQLHKAAELHGIFYPDSYVSESADSWIDLLFSELVQPKLDAVIVYDYCGSQSQLAKTRREGNDEISERFELFLHGIEIANGYNELLDATELRRRMEENLQYRLADDRSPLPTESRLLTAMEQGFPPCSGTALGIDRLLMVMLRAKAIDEVIPFPIETA